MAGKVLSIEIGTNVTRICLTDYKVKNPKVYKYAKFVTPENVLADGDVHPTEEFVGLLKDTLAQNGMKCKQVVFSLTSSRVASRDITIPLVKEKQIDPLIRSNLEDYFPIDLGQYEIGYTILEKNDAESYYRVQVLAVPQSLLNGYKQLASACGLQLVAADYSGNSIYQIVKNECKDGVKMVVKVDETSSIVTIIKDQSIALQRTVGYGINDAIRTMTEHRIFGVDTYEEAMDLAFRKTCMKLSINARELMMEEEIEDLEEDERLRKARVDVAKSLGMLLNGVGRTVDYYISRNAGESIDGVYITGLGADFSGISKLFTNELGIQTVSIKHLGGQSLERSFQDGRFGEYITCVGAVIAPLGLVGTEKTGKNKSSKENDYTAIAYLLLIGGTLIGVALVSVSVLGYLQARDEHAAYVRRLNELTEIRTIYATYTATATAHEQVEQLYAETENHNEQLVAFLEEMEDKLPADIQVQTFTAALDSVTMSIRVTSKEAMANTVQQLRSFDSIDSVSVSGAQDSASDEGVREVSFSVNCVYKTMEQLAAEAETAQE